MHLSRRLAFAWPALVAACALASLTACTAPVIVAAGASSAVAVARSDQSAKGFDATIDDVRIDASVNRHLFAKNVDLFRKVTVTVEKGRVFLTGSVEIPEHRIEAARQAWQVEGVREVLNELQVRDSSSLIDRARDAVINTRLKSSLLLDSEIDSVNFSTDTVNRVVYLFGIARTADERDRVVGHARSLDSIVDVVDHIVVTGTQ